jgi:hypothetical protein
MNKKSIFLFIAFLLPISVFVFLKLAGKNNFDIPVYYENGIDSLNAICGKDYSKPYAIDDSVLTKLKWVEKESSVLILGSASALEMKRLNDTFLENEYSIYSINNSNYKNQVEVSDNVFSQWKNCVFVAKEKINTVLIDKQKRIRGYYSIGSREEMDRLIVEMKILLKKY